MNNYRIQPRKRKVRSPKIWPLLFLVAMLLQPDVCLARQINLFASSGESIVGVLPEDWLPMTKEELQRFGLQGEIRQNGSGHFPAGYKLQGASDKEGDDPFLLVLTVSGPQIHKERIQKMFSWLEGNKKIMRSILPDTVESMAIEDIEFLPDFPGIIFQTAQQVGNTDFTSISGLVFLKEGYLNIIGYGEKQSFSRYHPVFETFIHSLSIPPALQHPMCRQQQPLAALFLKHWQRILGVFIIIGVYGFAFLKKR